MGGGEGRGGEGERREGRGGERWRGRGRDREACHQGNVSAQGLGFPPIHLLGNKSWSRKELPFKGMALGLKDAQ